MKETANVLNDYFATVFTQEPEGPLPEFTVEPEPPLLDNIEITEDHVLKAIAHLNPSKTPGPDNLHPKLLVETKDTIVKPFNKIVQNINRNQYITIRLERSICNTNIQKRFKEKTGKLQTNQFNISPLQNITENNKRQNSRNTWKHTVCLTFTSTVLDQNTHVSHNY